MSGGVDSSLVAFLLAKTIVDNNLDTNVIPIVIVEETSPFQEIFSIKVIDFIEHATTFKFNNIEVFNCSEDENKIKKMRDVEDLFREKVDIIISGTTHYPKDPHFTVPGGPDDDRNGVQQTLWDEWIYTPFINLDKREIANMYEQYKLTETLLPLTRSCVSRTTDFSTSCGNCWWCKEREWAFNDR